MQINRLTLDSLFSRASHWPSDGNWDRVARDTAEHLIEHPKTGILMVLVPAGKLPAFYVGVHAVTNAQYARFVAETGHHKPEKTRWGTPVWKNGTFPPDKVDHPVVCVDWDDATAYCRWAGLRLPTEMEWKKAAGGLDGRAYPWGEDWDPNRCRNGRNKGGETTADVWRYGQGGSPFGGLQFSGNVWEWCAGELAASSSGSSRVILGGAWSLDDRNDFSAYIRTRCGPNLCSDGRGFRCVCELNRPPLRQAF